MSECDFYIHAVVDDVAVVFYVEASSHTEASTEAMREQNAGLSIKAKRGMNWPAGRSSPIAARISHR
jgi:hypothetical protein